MISLCSLPESSLSAKPDMSPIKEFKWDKVTSDIEKNCPLLWNVLFGATTTRATEKTLKTRLGKNMLLILATIVGTLSYARNSRKMKVIQQLIGLQLWLGGVKRDVGNRLNVVNLRQGVDATLTTIDGLIKDSSKSVHEWKDAVTSYLRRPQSRRRLFEDDSDEDGWIDEDDDSIPTSFSLVFDNVNQKTHARHQSTTRKNTMLNMVQAYAAKDRIGSLHLSSQQPHPAAILDIPNESYLPSNNDVDTLHHEFRSAIGNILHKYCVFMPPNPPEARRPFHRESSIKSQVGILKKDESKTGEMVDIMHNYHQYVPENPDGTPFTIPLWCDGLSCERGHDAHVSVFNAMTRWSRLEGLAPSVQEWHRRQLQMEDLWKAAYSSTTPREVGTLYQLRNVLGMTNVESDVTKCMNHATEFCDIILDGYVVGMALTVMKTNVIDQPPQDFPEDEEEQLIYKENVIDQVMELAFHLPDIRFVNSDPPEEDCCCGHILPETTMVMCSNEGQCVGKTWYHVGCVGLRKAPKGKWVCNVCTTRLTEIDHKLEYTKIILWKLLNARVCHTAVRFNDGDAMMCHWRFDLVAFYLEHHTKYFIYAHRLLSAINGATSQQLAHTLKWNRTVNPSGGVGKNLEMDFKMEMYNRAYKESS